MSLKHLAEKVKAEGRHGDTELVHMTKGEVAGLQQLAMAAGGSLTINPDTGLPEAFHLRSILPGILGFALAPFTGGLSAAMIGAGTGALLNEDDRLGGALMGGLGAFGGHGIGAGLSAAGGAGAVGAAAGGMGPAAPTTFAGMGAGLKGLGTEAGRSAALTQMGGLGGLAKNVGMAGAPLIAGAMMPRGGSAEMPGEKEDTEDLMGRYEYRANPITGGRATGPAATGERMYFDPEFRRRPSVLAAQGGQVYAEGGGIAELARGGMKAGGFVVPADVVSMVGEGNTDAGYERIKRMLPGATPIKGKDGGQADTVKTSIEGKQPARVAHGEMYVPPEDVKRAGGAKKLYAMMKNVRKMAKGDDKQIEPVDLREAMA
jgi:hypothetical protein